MISRYTLPEMGAIWSEENKFRTWLQVELAVCEALERMGRIPEGTAAEIRRNEPKIDVERIEWLEKNETRHDLIAFVKSITEQLGDEGKYVHFGVTSYDIEDPALSLRLRQSADLLLADCQRLADVIKKRASEHKYTLEMGRTHGIHAEPVTFGFKLAVWYAEMLRNIERLMFARGEINAGKISGAVGTYANTDPEVEQYVCEKLGLTPALVSTQILQRDRHAHFLTTLAVIASSVEKFATEIRNLQRTEIREVEEFFAQGQRGSSAMPHKRNPWNSETVSGIARVIRGYVIPALENVTTWHERDLANSSVERIILPDACILLDFQLQKFANIVEGLIVYPENMRKNIDLMGGLVASQQVMLALIDKGMSREDAYKAVQSAAMKAWEDKNFRQHLKDDPQITSHLSEEELEASLNPEYHLHRLDVIFDRLGI
ncbi:MAG: adenylosuccinate lyase [Armatimonadetes bacterium]|nr:adenylosuccinate lyase [Armatimonadota bacterium]